MFEFNRIKRLPPYVFAITANLTSEARRKGEEECIAKEYKSAHDLLLHIKKTGTAGWHRKIKHPLTPSRINLLDEWFTKTYGSCRVTYQIFFLQAKNL